MTLGQQCLVGRASRSALQLLHPAVSGAHARLAWSHGEWLLRDLASRNGTLVFPQASSAKGILLHATSADPALSQSLQQGAVLEFGGPEERWCLADASAPALRARRADGLLITAEDDALAFPDNEHGGGVVRRGGHGDWRLHTGGKVRSVSDQDTVRVGSAEWLLELPATIAPLDTTAVGRAEQERASEWSLDQVTLSIQVSHDGDDIDTHFEGAGRSLLLEGYVFNELLLSLAHRFLEDRRTHPSRHVSEHGWMDIAALLRLPSVDGDRRRLAQLVFQIRKHLGRADLEGHRDIVEQRHDKRRIGVQHLSITFL